MRGKGGGARVIGLGRSGDALEYTNAIFKCVLNLQKKYKLDAFFFLSFPSHSPCPRHLPFLEELLLVRFPSIRHEGLRCRVSPSQLRR